jgi:TM2 domain-containing membrane protein YozV
MTETPPIISHHEQRHCDRVVAALLAVFLGFLGFHKFYLGKPDQGVTCIIVWLISSLLCLVLIGFLFLFVLWVVCLIEGLSYISMTQAQFDQTYDRDAAVHPAASGDDQLG